MARVEKGDLTGAIIQPDRSITEKNDGTLEGSIVWKCDASEADEQLPKLGDLHPDDDRLEVYNITRTYNSNGIVTANCSYFGLIASATPPVVSYSGGTNSDPIETHPNFSTLTSSSNYSYDDDGNFLGFTGGDLQGVQYYLTPSSTVTVSQWFDSKPILGARIAIVTRPIGTSGYIFSSDIKNWLLVDSPYRQVGNFYQVSNVYIASGPSGWNTKIY